MINAKREGRTASPLLRLDRKKLIAFGWYGGKFSHLEWLLPLLPDTLHYCEPFAGSAAVLLNKIPSPVETYNDVDGEVVNFFKVLRDDKENLIEKLAFTPFSREEFAIACEISPNLTPLERARRFYVRARQVRTGLAQTASIGRWANCKNTSRAGMSGVISRWLGGIEQLDFIAERLMRVQIENRPAIKVIELYDSPETLFYCDPPYIHETRGDNKAYAYEMTNEDHIELAETLNSVAGKVALSNYDCELMNDLYPAGKWTKHFGINKTIHSTKDKRQEVLWVNFRNKHPSLFKNLIMPELTPQKILDESYANALAHLATPFITNAVNQQKVLVISKGIGNKAPIRFLMSCVLAKIANPQIDIRKPYTEIEGEGTYSGRHFDETFIQPFIHKYKLPVNSTTAYLTPAFRSNNTVLTPDLVLEPV